MTPGSRALHGAVGYPPRNGSRKAHGLQLLSFFFFWAGNHVGHEVKSLGVTRDHTDRVILISPIDESRHRLDFNGRLAPTLSSPTVI